MSLIKLRAIIIVDFSVDDDDFADKDPHEIAIMHSEIMQDDPFMISSIINNDPGNFEVFVKPIKHEQKENDLIINKKRV